MADDVPADIKQERADELMDLQQGISHELNQQKVGHTHKVLFDRQEGGYFIGRTEADSPEVDNEVLVPVGDPGSRPYVRLGEFANVRVLRAEEFDLYGEII
jgi:ribosomal protein S12 methylthiotransferase